MCVECSVLVAYDGAQCRIAPWHAAGGTYNLVGGQWLDGSRPLICLQCPSSDPSIVVCNDNKVESQPGYFALYTSDSRRVKSYSTIKVLNLADLRVMLSLRSRFKGARTRRHALT